MTQMDADNSTISVRRILILLFVFLIYVTIIFSFSIAEEWLVHILAITMWIIAYTIYDRSVLFIKHKKRRWRAVKKQNHVIYEEFTGKEWTKYSFCFNKENSGLFEVVIFEQNWLPHTLLFKKNTIKSRLNEHLTGKYLEVVFTDEIPSCPS